jgi:hypothetical protein
MARRVLAGLGRTTVGPAGRVVALGAVLCAAGAGTGQRVAQVLGAAFLAWCLVVAALLRRGDAQGIQDP